MQSVPRVAARSACRLRAPLQQQQRRRASHQPEPQHHSGPAPPNESFGSGFYIGIMCIPLAIGLYTISRPTRDGQEPYLSRVINKVYADYATQNRDRNDLHVRAIEQAAADRTLFLSDPGQNVRHVEHRFPEFVNNSSPYNVPAGHGHANIDALIAKYQKEAYEDNERRHQQLRDNKVPAEQPYVPEFTKVTPAANDS